MSDLEKMSVKHDYYCSSANYYSNDAALSFETMSDFLDEFEDADVDMNLCFRWDIKNQYDSDGEEIAGLYMAEVFIMGQRKGLFIPCEIQSVKEEEIPRFKAYLEKHWRTMLQIWTPISGDNAGITKEVQKT